MDGIDYGLSKELFLDADAGEKQTEKAAFIRSLMGRVARAATARWLQNVCEKISHLPDDEILVGMEAAAEVFSENHGCDFGTDSPEADCMRQAMEENPVKLAVLYFIALHESGR